MKLLSFSLLGLFGAVSTMSWPDAMFSWGRVAPCSTELAVWVYKLIFEGDLVMG